MDVALGFEELPLGHAHERSGVAAAQESRQRLDGRRALVMRLQQADGIGPDGVGVGHRPTT